MSQRLRKQPAGYLEKLFLLMRENIFSKFKNKSKISNRSMFNIFIKYHQFELFKKVQSSNSEF